MKNFLTLLMLLFIFTLVSCGEVSLRTETQIHMNTINNIKLVLTYDNTVKDTLGNNLLKKYVNKDLKVNYTYNNDSKLYIEELQLNKDELDTYLSNTNLSEFIKLDTTSSKSLFKNHYSFQLKFLDTPKNIVDPNLTKFIDDVPFSNQITIPGKIVASNASKVIDGNNLEWNYSLDQISSDTQISFDYETISMFRITLCICISLILIYLIYYFIRKNKLSKS